MHTWLIKHHSAIPFTLFFIFLGMIVTYSLVAYFTYAKQTRTSLKLMTQENMEKIEASFFEHTKRSKQIIEALTQNTAIMPLLTEEQTNRELVNLFNVVAHSNDSIMQLRLLDHQGRERIRFQRDTEELPLTQVEQEALQDKSHRDYFIRSKTHASTSFFSDLNLNIEKGKIETPYKPVYRILLPLHFQDEFKGVIVLNVFAKKLLEKLNEYSQHKIIVFDSEGYALYHDDPNRSWGRYREPAVKIETKYMESLKDTDIPSNMLPIIHQMTLPFANTLYLLIDINRDKLEEILTEHRHRFLLIGLFFVLLSLLTSILMGRYLKRVAHQIKQQEMISDEHEKTLLQKSRFIDMSNLLSMIAHQWRQPISVLMGVLGNLGYELEEKLPDSKQTLKKIDEAEEMLIYLTRTIEDFRNMFNDDKIIHNFDLLHLIIKTYHICGSMLESHKINTILVYPDKDGTPVPLSLKQNGTDTPKASFIIRGPSGELQQVLLNLLTNAKDALIATEDQNREKNIHIRLERWESLYHLSVSDNGSGISLKNQHHIFDPYWSTKKNQNGTGLGLYMSKLIIQRSFGGEIQLSSILNEGSTFTLLLPSERKENHG